MSGKIISTRNTKFHSAPMGTFENVYRLCIEQNQILHVFMYKPAA